jgi:hypothetical protein
MSNVFSPKLKQLARRLLAHEASSSKPADAQNSTAFHVCEKLREPLAKFLGGAGFCALLSRAQALAGREVPWLLGLTLKADGSIDGLDELEGKFKARVVAEGEIVLVAQLIGLLATFIGAELTQRFLHEIWPDMEDLTF